MQLVISRTQPLGIVLEAMQHGGKIAERLTRLLGKALEQLFGSHPEGQLGGAVRHGRRDGLLSAQLAGDRKGESAHAAEPYR